MTSFNSALQNPYTTLVASNRLVTFPNFKSKKVTATEEKSPSKNIEVTDSGTTDDKATFHPAQLSVTNTASAPEPQEETEASSSKSAPTPQAAPPPAAPTRAQKLAGAQAQATGGATTAQQPQGPDKSASTATLASTSANLAASSASAPAAEDDKPVIYPIPPKAMAQINAAADKAVEKAVAAGMNEEQQKKVREQTMENGKKQFQIQMTAAKAKAKAKAQAALAASQPGGSTSASTASLAAVAGGGGGGGGAGGTGGTGGAGGAPAPKAKAGAAAPAGAAAAAGPAPKPGPAPIQLTQETLPSFVLTVVPPGTVYQCSVLRSKAGIFPRFDLFIEAENQFLLAAKREGKFNYLMSTVATDISKTSQYYAGKVKRMVITNTFVVYGAGKGFKKLKDGEKVPRDSMREELAFLTIPEVEAGVRTICSWIPPVGENAMRQCIRPLKPTESITSVKDINPSSLLQLISRKPTLNPTTKKYQMDFRGRAKMASIKNQQMILGSNPNLTLQESPNVFQFGKITDNRFSLDFSWPLCPLQAFAMALVIFDIG